MLLNGGAGEGEQNKNANFGGQKRNNSQTGGKGVGTLGQVKKRREHHVSHSGGSQREGRPGKKRKGREREGIKENGLKRGMKQKQSPINSKTEGKRRKKKKGTGVKKEKKKKKKGGWGKKIDSK